MYPLASSAPDGRTPASPRFPEIERRILAYWDEDGTFQASIDQRPTRNEDGSQNEFVFYDGPPFANGLPHYGHLLTGYVKDLVARYQTQQGRRVERRFGWDTHGLPAELEAMKQLGMTDKAEIEAKRSRFLCDLVPVASEALWAAASMPRARPETVVNPASPRPRASRAAIFKPGKDALREPTRAAMGRSKTDVSPFTARMGGAEAMRRNSLG